MLSIYRPARTRFSLAILLVTLMSWINIAVAEESSQSENVSDEDEIQEVVVSIGSFISRTLSDQPVPVLSIARDQLARLGRPSTATFIDQLSVSSGSYIRSNQFNGSGTATGLKTINLRGLGVNRNLVLLNGKRLAPAPVAAQYNQNTKTEAVDLGSLPSIAVERTNILTNGGDVTYGSDAISGVINFVTRDYFEGFELETYASSYHSDEADNGVGLIFGKTFENARFVVAAEHEKIFEYTAAEFEADRGSVIFGDGQWPYGISSFGNPGTWFTTDLSASLPDPLCGEVDSTGNSDFLLPNGRCGFSYLIFGSMIDPNERDKFFASGDVYVSDRLTLRFEALHSNMTSEYKGSPSYPALTADAGLTPTLRFWNLVPASNPGYQDFLSRITPDQRDQFESSAGALWWGRSRGASGPAVSFPREHTTSRYTLSVESTVFDTIDWTAAAYVSTAKADIGATDILSARFKLALQGLGGPDCQPRSDSLGSVLNDPIRGVASSGCYWFIPSGAANLAQEGDAIYQNPQLHEWMLGQSSGISENKLSVLELSFAGTFDIALFADEVAWQMSVQDRNMEVMYSPTGDNACDGPCDTPFHFLGTDVPDDYETEQSSLALEAILPITEKLTADIGIRYEDFEIDSIMTPKLSFIYELRENLSLRGSYQEVMRAPDTAPESSGLRVASLARDSGGRDIYVDVRNSTAGDVEAEQSNNFSFGLLWSPGKNQNLIVDYYDIDFSGALTVEDASCSCAAKFLADGTSYDPSVHSLADVRSVETDVSNSDLTNRVRGIDLQFNSKQLVSTNEMLFEVLAGLNAQYLLSFDFDTLDGRTLNGAGNYYDGSYRGDSLDIRSLPKFKGTAFVSTIFDTQQASLMLNYVSGLDVPEEVQNPLYATVDSGLPSYSSAVKGHFTADIHYSRRIQDSLEITFSVFNLFDREAPIAPHDQAYIAELHNPVGRMYKAGFVYRLGQQD